MFESRELWTSNLKFWASQILKFDPFDKQHWLYLVCAKCSELYSAVAPLMLSIVRCILSWGS